MTMMYNTNEIKNIISKLKIPEYTYEIYLVGSYARGEAKENSDLDFLVINHGAVGWDNYLLGGIFEDVFNKQVDIILKEDLKNNKYLKYNILKDRIKIYDKRKSV